MMHAFLLLLLAGTSTVVAAGGKDCHPSDKAAMVAVHAALGNPYNSIQGYPCCEWFDVDCDPFTGRVVGLSIFKQPNLTAVIPNAIGGLTHLQTLMLHHLPGLSGPIPPAIIKLTNISQLIISWTAVSGPVPSFLGTLPNLFLLDLSFNSLTGAIPASLAAIPNLYGINLSRNRLTGAIPPLLLSKTTDEVYLWLSHNNLSGAIPAGFATVNFVHVDLSRNALAGDASVLFGRGKVLQYLDLSRNNLTFDLSGVEFPEHLGFVDVSHNIIRGGIPAQVANVTNLVQFNVSYNQLCGAVPSGVARFDAYSFQHNKCLCGAPLPACK